jgi:hypothetical protein
MNVQESHRPDEGARETRHLLAAWRPASDFDRRFRIESSAGDRYIRG